MTIPTLIADYQEKVTVTKVKKIYSTLNNAYALYLVDNSTPQLVEISEAGAIEAYNIFAKQLKVAKDCGTRGEGCIYTGAYKARNNSPTTIYQEPRYYKIKLNDGATIIFRGGKKTDRYEYIADLWYDVNGKEGPNQYGHDFFEFLLTKDAVIPLGIPSFPIEKFEDACAKENASGYGCTAWVIYKGNLDYLKCNNLTWDKMKCD